MQAIGVWLIEIVLGLFGLQRKQPPVKAEERAGRAEANLQTEQAANDQVEKAAAAAAAVDAGLVRDPGSLRAPDRYSRD